MTRALFWRDAWRRASPQAQLTACFAAAVYLCQGLQLTALSTGLDFVCFHDAASAVVHGYGKLVYEGFLRYVPGTRIERMFFVYPPFVALLYGPLGLFSFPVALSLFQLACHGALWACVLLAARRAPAGKELLAGSLVLLFWPLYYSLQLGQSDLPALACLMAALAVAEGYGWEGEAAAGALLATAASLKLFLLLGAGALLLTRRWRLLCWSAAFFTAFQAAGLFAVPWDAQRAYWARLGRPIGVEAFVDNLSLNGMLLRLFTRTPYARGLVDAPVLAKALRALLSGGVLAAFAAALWRRPKASLDAAVAFSVTTALLVAPVSDTHHLAFLLPGLLLLLEAGECPAFPALACYAVLALTQPPVAYKFLARERLDLFLWAPLNLLLPLSFWALAALWALWARKLKDLRTT